MKYLALLLLLSSSAWSQDQYPVFSLPPFKEGLHTRYSSNAIPDGALSEALNVVVDEDIDGVVVARKGYSKYNTTLIPNNRSIRGMWSFDSTDGTKYFMAMSSSSFYKSVGDGIWTAVTGLDSFSLDKDFDCVTTIGKFWCANGDTVFSWDGVTTATVTGAPLGNIIGKFRNRVLLSGIAGSKGRVRGSGELDGSDYVLQTPGVSTTPFSIAVGGADDGEDITCLMGAYQDVFIIGKRNSLWGLYGFGRNDFQLRELSREIGCLEQRSVREKNNCLYWISLRGVERYCGANVTRVSDPIRDQLDTIIASAGNLRSAVDTSESDFTAGNMNLYANISPPVTATRSPGNLTTSTFTAIDTNSTDFLAGTIPSLLSTGITGSLSYSSSSYRIYNGDVEDGALYWTFTPDSLGTGVASWGAAGAISGTYGLINWAAPTGSPQIHATILDENDVYLYEVVSSYPNYDILSGTIDLYALGLSTRTLKIQFAADSGSLLSRGFITSSTFTAISSISWQGEAQAGQYGWGKLDNIKINRYFSLYQTSATPQYFLSRTFDSVMSTPMGGPFYVGVSTPAGTSISNNVRTSVDGSSWGSFSAVSSGTTLPSAQRYYQYGSSFTTSVGTSTPYFLDATLNTGNTGYFISQCRNPGTGITSWGIFFCNQELNSGRLSYSISIGTTCDAVTRATATWTTQTNNTVIALATSSYVAYRAYFDYDAGTQTAKIRDCTISWQEGATRPPVATSVYKDRYYLAYTSSTALGTINDHVLVLDKNDKWTIFDDHYCYSLNNYGRKLYCGNSGGSGRVWLLDSGYDDDGSIITSRIRTKSYNLGIPDRRKIFDRIYLDLEPSPDPTQTISLTGRYTLERSTPVYSLGTVDLNEDPGSIMTSKFPFPITNPVSGKYIQLELESSGLASPWRLFGGRLYYKPLDLE